MDNQRSNLENDSKENFSSPLLNSPPLIVKKDENFVTPLRRKRYRSYHTPQTPQFTQTPTRDPITETPNGSKISHPFLSTIIRNLDKSIMSPGLFNIREDSLRSRKEEDDSALSPDISGVLFPVEIDVNIDTQYRFEKALFHKYEKYCNNKSDIFFQQDQILPSPDPHDSAKGSSIQTSCSETSHRDSKGPLNLLLPNTPPSKYKWNRPEYHNGASSSRFTNNMSRESFENDDSLDLSSAFNSHKANLESTKIFDDAMGLAYNLSMRNHSIIESSMFDYDEEEKEDEYEEIFSASVMRSSPGDSRHCSRALQDLEISPIRAQDAKMDSDDDDGGF